MPSGMNQRTVRELERKVTRESRGNKRETHFSIDGSKQIVTYHSDGRAILYWTMNIPIREKTAIMKNSNIMTSMMGLRH